MRRLIRPGREFSNIHVACYRCGADRRLSETLADLSGKEPYVCLGCADDSGRHIDGLWEVEGAADD